jgi:hypothetical protein
LYQPSDWATARYVAEAMSKNLNQGQHFSSVLFSAVIAASGDLLATEGSRRRLRLDLDRARSDPSPTTVALMERYRRAASDTPADTKKQERP